MRRLAVLVVILGFVTPVRASAAGDLDQARHAVQAGDVRGGGQGPRRAGARHPHPRHRERARGDRAGGRPARRAGDAARHADADRDLRHGGARASTGSPTTSSATKLDAPVRLRRRQGRDQGADQVSVQHSGGRGQLQAARRRDVRAGQPAAEGGQRSRSGQGRSGLLRQVAALVHHRSRRELRDPARAQHRLGRRAGDHHRQAGVQGRRSAGARLRVRLQHHVRPQRSRRHRPPAADRHVQRPELVRRQERRSLGAVRSVHRAEGVRRRIHPRSTSSPR